MPARDGLDLLEFGVQPLADDVGRISRFPWGVRPKIWGQPRTRCSPLTAYQGGSDWYIVRRDLAHITRVPALVPDVAPDACHPACQPAASRARPGRSAAGACLPSWSTSRARDMRPGQALDASRGRAHPPRCHSAAMTERCGRRRGSRRRWWWTDRRKEPDRCVAASRRGSAFSWHSRRSPGHRCRLTSRRPVPRWGSGSVLMTTAWLRQGSRRRACSGRIPWRTACWRAGHGLRPSSDLSRASRPWPG
jgi:hypothetical protein